MKTTQHLLFLLIAMFLMASCVEDKVYEGPSSITSVALSPEAPTSFEDVTVTAKVEGLQAVSTATLAYTAGSTTQTVSMTSASSGTYTATIPAQPDGTKVSFTITIVNEAGYTTTVEKDYTVGDKPADYTKLVFNELYAAASADEEKFIELYNNSDTPIKLKDVTINKDEKNAWTGIDGEVIPAHGYFTIVGAKGTTKRGITSGFSNKKSVILELFDPNGNRVDVFQRGEKGDGWGNQSLDKIKLAWSRCPDGTGKFMLAEPTLGAANPSEGEEAADVVQ